MFATGDALAGGVSYKPLIVAARVLRTVASACSVGGQLPG
jgi:hypothetical protein